LIDTTTEKTMDVLTKALMAAGVVLAREHGWCFDGDPGCPPLEDNPFITVVRKYVEPMVDVDGWRNVRIAALKAELALLETTPNAEITGG
jgi:hypothetical protein